MGELLIIRYLEDGYTLMGFKFMRELKTGGFLDKKVKVSKICIPTPDFSPGG
jgi:hypothetical protein